jgi:hypothetical protein
MRIARTFTSLTLLALGAASCADPENSAFDPGQDPVPPALLSFAVESRDGEGETFALASWRADEPVRAVIEYGPVGTPMAELPLHSYSLIRSFESSGSVKLVGAEPRATYRYAVRMWDRAGNESSSFLANSPEFTTGDLTPEDLLLVAMIDVGWGDAIYLQAPDGTNVQIDAGHPQDGVLVREFFERHGVTSLDFASMTHVHEDHIGGFYGDDFNELDGLFQINLAGSPNAPIPVRNAFLDILDKTLTNGPYADLLDAIDAHSTLNRHVRLRTGESSLGNEDLRWGDGVRVDLLSAGRKPFLIPDHIVTAEPGSVINNDSMIYRVQYGDFVALLTGDGEFASEQFLQDSYTKDFLRATVLKLGHHGSNDANSERFIDFVEPMIGLIPNAIRENPGVEHPFVLNRLRNRSIDYYASDRVIPNRDRALPGARGDVLVWTDGSAFTVEIENLRYE